MKIQLANKKTLTKARPALRKIVSAAGRQLVRSDMVSPKALLTDVRELILAARKGVARAVNAGLVSLYREIGTRIRKDILKEKCAEYGERIVSALGTQLEQKFGRGFSRRNLFNMIQFAEVFSDRKIVQSLTAQLGWTHFTLLLPLGSDPLIRHTVAKFEG